jgi:hypothetical protein
MEEQIINLKKLVNTQSKKIDFLEKRITILERCKKEDLKNQPCVSARTPINNTLFNRLRNKKRNNNF